VISIFCPFDVCVCVGCISQEEAEMVVQSWSRPMIAGAASGPLDSVNSYAATRSGQQLKRHIRAFADRHSRPPL